MPITTQNQQVKKGVLLVNLGTPDSTSIKDIRRYLREFLSDKRVLNMPAIARWLLLNAVILPFRPKKIQSNYQHIWTDSGSPLTYYTKNLATGVAQELGESYYVQYAMRYQTPSLQTTLIGMLEKGITDILVVPLFPQYAAATSGSLYACIFDILTKRNHIPAITFLDSFFAKDFFIKAQAEIARPYLQEDFDHLLFTYHGLPKNHLTALGDSGQNTCYTNKQCCAQITHKNSYCYKAQCYATTRALVKALGIDDKTKYSTSFQSRFGPTEWLKPYTTEKLQELAQKNQRLVVICPSFVADCIETLDEIGTVEKQKFIATGGKSLKLVPCVNDSTVWVNELSKAIKCKTSI